MFAKTTQTALAAAAAFFVLLCAAAAAQSDKGSASGSPQLEGTWEVKVDLINPPPFMPEEFTALETYSRGGGMITSNDVPFLTRVGQGAWEGAGGQHLVKIKFFTFDANGLPSGTINVTHAITLDGKDEYSGKGTALLCAPDGTSCATAHFDTTGRRLSAQP